MPDSEIEWEQARSEFEWDGTLRDLSRVPRRSAPGP